MRRALFAGEFGRSGELVTAKVKALPGQLGDMLHAVLDRLEADLGRSLVRSALCLILCSHSGLQASELLVLLAPPGEERLSINKWSNLLQHCQNWVRRPQRSRRLAWRAARGMSFYPDVLLRPSAPLSHCHASLAAALSAAWFAVAAAFLGGEE